MRIKLSCEKCGLQETVELPSEAFVKWNTGGKVKDCFPNLTKQQQELLTMKLCSPCYDKVLGIDC